jgi:hypothetical protein
MEDADAAAAAAPVKNDLRKILDMAGYSLMVIRTDISHLTVYQTLFYPFDANNFTKFNLNYQDFSFPRCFLADLYKRPDLQVPDCLKSLLESRP